jgi:hypothetical protein
MEEPNGIRIEANRGEGIGTHTKEKQRILQKTTKLTKGVADSLGLVDRKPELLRCLLQKIFGFHFESMLRAISATLEPRILCASASKWIPSIGLRLTISLASRKSHPDLPACQA